MLAAFKFCDIKLSDKFFLLERMIIFKINRTLNFEDLNYKKIFVRKTDGQILFYFISVCVFEYFF